MGLSINLYMKRGVLWIIIIALLSNIVFADSLFLNITNNITAVGKNLEGYAEFELKNPVSKDTELLFDVDGEKFREKLIDFVENSKYEIMPATYKKKTNPNLAVLKNIDFNGLNSKINVGIDIGSGRTVNDIQEVLQFVFKISSSSGEPSAKIDIGNDNSADYVFMGSDTGQQKDMDSSYLADNEPDEFREIRGQNYDTFCQEIKLEPSKKFDVLVKGNLIQSGGTLTAAILDEPSSYFECGTGEGQESCCTLTKASGSEYFSCSGNKIEKEATQEKNYYACISVFDGSTDSFYYSIGVDKNNKKVQGYYGSQKTNFDYYIKAKMNIFNDKLNSAGEAHTFEPDTAYDYVHKDSCGNSCLLIPINITSKYAGAVTLSDLVLRFSESSGGVVVLDKFVDIDFIPESVKYKNKIRINLENFENLLAPESDDHKIFVELNNLKSQEIKFISAEGPDALIRVSNLNPGINEAVSFNGEGSKAKDNKKIVKYSWNFEGVIKEGAIITYNFLTSGEKEAILTVTDDDGVAGKDRIKLNVGNTAKGDQASNAIELIKEARVLISAGDTQFRDTAALLNISEKLNDIEENILVLNKSIDSYLKNGKIQEANKLSEQLNEYADTIISSMSVSVSTFPSGVLTLGEIPNSIASTDELKKNILSAQKEINGEARVVSIIYANGDGDNFVIIKKQSIGTGDLYEILPAGLTKKDILTEGYKLASNNIIKFSNTNNFVYLAEGDLASALETKTILVPLNLEVEEQEEISDKVKFGSDLPRIILTASALLVIILIIYFGMFFRGGLFNKKDPKSYFNNTKDYYSLKTFVQTSLNRKLKPDQIKLSLKKKGWKDKQIKAIFSEFKK